MLNRFDGSNCVTVNLVQKKKEKGIVDRLYCAVKKTKLKSGIFGM